MKHTAIIVVASFFCVAMACGQTKMGYKRAQINRQDNSQQVLPGACQTEEYIPLLQGERVGVFANNTAMIANTHLVDSLKKAGINISKIFGPEHGFRGTANAGEKVDNYIDSQTGIKVISLYGKKRKPTAEDLADVDVLLFDIQDVGVRFYTYISSLQDFIETAIAYDKPLIILDRPNPNGFYVDGPILDTAFKSFIGMQPVPIVYGMTIGEYANFLVGEQLLTTGNGTDEIDMTVIKCKNYTHRSRYVLPVKPSPNLPDAGAVFWYPSTCLFEGTVLSEGRGTDHPFEIFGHPALPAAMYAFTPVANAGAASPKLKGKLCYGWNLSGIDEGQLSATGNHLQLEYLLQAYKLFPQKDSFFIQPNKMEVKPTDYVFNRLAGNAELMQQIKDDKTEAEIRASWEPKLAAFKKVRKKYLLYDDFDSAEK